MKLKVGDGRVGNLFGAVILQRHVLVRRLVHADFRRLSHLRGRVAKSDAGGWAAKRPGKGDGPPIDQGTCLSPPLAQMATGGQCDDDGDEDETMVMLMEMLVMMG